MSPMFGVREYASVILFIPMVVGASSSAAGWRVDVLNVHFGRGLGVEREMKEYGGPLDCIGVQEGLFVQLASYIYWSLMWHWIHKRGSSGLTS
jgi:hypothetical protein